MFTRAILLRIFSAAIPAFADRSVRYADSYQYGVTTAELGAGSVVSQSRSADGTSQKSLCAQVAGHAFAGGGVFEKGDGFFAMGVVDATGAVGVGNAGLQNQGRVRTSGGVYGFFSVGAEASHLSVGDYSENVVRGGWNLSAVTPLGKRTHFFVQAQAFGKSHTRLTDHRGSRELTLNSSGVDLGVLNPRVQARLRAYQDEGDEGRRRELALSGKVMLGNLIGQKTYGGAEFTSISTRDTKPADAILREPSLNSSVGQVSASAGFAF